MEISNAYLIASFQAKGAELISLIGKETGIEYIWQADPSYWPRHAPVLFPIVGRLKEDAFSYQNKMYRMSQHGFARDETFSVVSLEQDQIHFSLTGSLQMLEKFPFRFNLLISYKLVGATLEVNYEVRNTNTTTMYFSIGGHPAFNCPLAGRGSRSDYWLEFAQHEEAVTQLLMNGLLSGETRRALEGRRLPVTDELFEADALVFKHLKSDSVSLCNKDKNWLTCHFGGFPYLGIWSRNSQSPFVCIEPWHGLADNHSHDQELERKEGIQALEPENNFQCSYQIEIHE